MARNYYYLVSGLREYNIDTDTKGFDALAIRREISEELQTSDWQYLRELYTFYDVANIIALWNGKNSFNPLGNYTREQLEEEIKQPENLPPYIAGVILAYKNRIKEDKLNEIDETIDTDIPFDKTLWTRFYQETSRSGNNFIRHWYDFDKQLRNISAAYTARKIGREIEPELIGQDDINSALSRNSSSDFGLKAEVDYIDPLIQLLDNKNMVEKERQLDLLRWSVADNLTDFDYFNMNKILAYCVKLNIIHRWMNLDKQIGYEMFRKLVDELTGREIVSRAVDAVEGLDTRAKRVR
ncbi:MAG: DUF2764 domain-containing protein, partial [Rikenellaceae bacterium]|nr:DUF2764 domain-containing protein [Rikenellaceae bacterium]